MSKTQKKTHPKTNRHRTQANPLNHCTSRYTTLKATTFAACLSRVFHDLSGQADESCVLSMLSSSMCCCSSVLTRRKNLASISQHCSQHQLLSTNRLDLAMRPCERLIALLVQAFPNNLCCLGSQKSPSNPLCTTPWSLPGGFVPWHVAHTVCKLKWPSRLYKASGY